MEIRTEKETTGSVNPVGGLGMVEFGKRGCSCCKSLFVNLVSRTDFHMNLMWFGHSPAWELGLGFACFHGRSNMWMQEPWP